MSDHGREHCEVGTGADAIQVHAADWVLARRLTGAWNEADQQALDAWRESSLANHLAYLRLDAAWDRAIRLEALRPLGPVEVEPRERPRILVRVAAVLGIVAVLGILGFYLAQPGTKTYATGVGGHELVTFADGTKIELNTNTVLRARMTTSERVAWLEKGEAFFQVKHDPAHPFVVMAGDRRVTDLGTKFLVRRDSSRFEVAVVQGRVWFDAFGKKSAAQAALLSEGDDAIASANAISVTKKSDQTLARQLGWRQGVLVFDRVRLADAASEFNRYNHRKIVFADPAAGDHMIGGTFPATDVDAFTSAVQIAFGLHVQSKADEIVISH